MSTGFGQGDPVPETPAPLASPPPSRPWYRRRMVGVLGAGVGILAYFAAKLAIGFLAASVVGGAITGAFGNPWQRLPSDVRAGFEARLESAYGDVLDDLSKKAAAQQVETDIGRGMLRLDDETLIRRMRLFTTALDAVAIADCADFGRASLAGQKPSGKAVDHLQAAFDAAAFQGWMEIAVAAVEAELRDNPEARTIPDAQQEAAVGSMIATLDNGEIQLLQGVVGNDSATDEDVCSVIRSLYDASLAMDPATLAVIAFTEVSQ